MFDAGIPCQKTSTRPPRPKRDSPELSREELADYFNCAIATLEGFLLFNQFVNTADFYHNKLTERLLNILENYAPEPASSWVNRTYSILTTPAEPVWIQNEQEDLLRLLIEIQNVAPDRKDLELMARVPFAKFDVHAQKYFWISYEQEGPINTAADFHETASGMLQTGLDAALELFNLKNRRRNQI